jgi:hypothetical protein
MRTDSPNTGYRFVNGADLSAVSNTAVWAKVSDGYVSVESPLTSFFGFAGIDLPDGATVTRLTAHYYDNSTAVDGNFRCIFRRRLKTEPDAVNVLSATGATSGQSTSIQTASAVAPVTIDEAQYAYVLVGQITFGQTADVRLYGCELEFTYTLPTP